ncbi:hypothetical protein NDS46_31490 (plasmid) [Paenibacillus thiaminolyticus]|uniref:hypothetical protein n=1 Tax=Paenibacillus thiaminolyticus TaxID=49283 RepID=UPI00232EEF09|nr:hypothetical protein [Paenibacillus thiaminolyticus]WCF11482.1 hypothetical protein NDS46_31490 [Paenibacillus thiaminolyticus]
MRQFNVFIEHDDTWKYFGTFKANDGEKVLELARSSKKELLKIYSFTEEELLFVNMEFEELLYM